MKHESSGGAGLLQGGRDAEAESRIKEQIELMSASVEEHAQSATDSEHSCRRIQEPNSRQKTPS
jgi:hypothetical protein